MRCRAQNQLRFILSFASGSSEAAVIPLPHPAHPTDPLTRSSLSTSWLLHQLQCENFTGSFLSLSVMMQRAVTLRFGLIVSITLCQTHRAEPTKITLAIDCWRSSFPKRGAQVCLLWGTKHSGPASGSSSLSLRPMTVRFQFSHR